LYNMVNDNRRFMRFKWKKKNNFFFKVTL
jgi:hypothetical protein